jgi:hypothetical protein
MALQALPAILEKGIDPSLDNALLQVMLTGSVNDRLVPLMISSTNSAFRFELHLSMNGWFTTLLFIALPPLFLFTAYHWYSL